MQTILDPTDFRHHRLLEQWNEAVKVSYALRQWREANPPPGTSSAPYGSPEWQRHADWLNALRAEEERLGLSNDDDYRMGRILCSPPFHAATVHLRRLARDTDDSPLFGDRVVQCPHCTRLFATFSYRDQHCSAECRESARSAEAASKAKIRRERNARQSAALANRSGTCLACGEKFTIKRITAKTCSEACKKRLQRKPELADKYLHLPPVSADLKAMEAELETVSEQEEKRLKSTIHLQRCYQRLHQMAPMAPALTAWLAKQSDDEIRSAFRYETCASVLGPDLKARLGIYDWTDAALLNG